jgi:MCP family monocarboxylic acid transporter-like MFS transporter 10
VGSVVWGIPNSYGVFLNAYLNDPNYTQQRNASNLLPLIGPMSSGIMHCSGIVVFPCLSRYPQHMRKILITGTFLCIFSLLGAGFVTQISALFALQGVLFSIGGSMLYAPCIRYMTQWFVKRRGLANGIIFSGTGVGGLVFPIFLSHLLEHQSPSTTLKILTIPVSCLLLLSLPFIRGRLPDTRVSGPAPTGSWLGFDRAWLGNWMFWMAIAVNTLQGFGYFVPLLWLPSMFCSSFLVFRLVLGWC